jgi:hypothetical protein
VESYRGGSFHSQRTYDTEEAPPSPRRHLPSSFFEANWIPMENNVERPNRFSFPRLIRKARKETFFLTLYAVRRVLKRFNKGIDCGSEFPPYL